MLIDFGFDQTAFFGRKRFGHFLFFPLKLPNTFPGHQLSGNGNIPGQKAVRRFDGLPEHPGRLLPHGGNILPIGRQPGRKHLGQLDAVVPGIAELFRQNNSLPAQQIQTADAGIIILK